MVNRNSAASSVCLTKDLLEHLCCCPLSLRRFDVTSNPIRPTWVPYSSTQSAVEDLQFSLKLMTSMCTILQV